MIINSGHLKECAVAFLPKEKKPYNEDILNVGKKMSNKYINPYTDFGFKRLFGEEAGKDLLVDFLNQLLPAYHQINTLHFKNSEKLNDTPSERKAIFDIYCETSTGEKFIVEMQKAKVKYFKERSLFYSTFPIKEQAQKGGWNFNLFISVPIERRNT